MRSLKIVQNDDVIELRCPKCDVVLALKVRGVKGYYFVGVCRHYNIRYLTLVEYMKLALERKVVLAEHLDGIFRAIVSKK